MLLVEKYIRALHREGVQEVIQPMFLTKYFKQIILQKRNIANQNYSTMKYKMQFLSALSRKRNMRLLRNWGLYINNNKTVAFRWSNTAYKPLKIEEFLRIMIFWLFYPVYSNLMETSIWINKISQDLPDISVFQLIKNLETLFSLGGLCE